ncbi:glycoside hydrolase family 18 [Pedobacter cryoconitis]|uniref:Glycosyl hydrolase family 18 (Putative chitinase) n=1 Tax=Pedobacter cryoconitis TaxID=188932 RepID=A0A7X0J1H5_9SPHI|nr:glycoside hydrolase family 18 [Pedobacter cryoconitis]MBB6499360.1 hypothetical protein [Pedobacter cryoconitis]
MKNLKNGVGLRALTIAGAVCYLLLQGSCKKDSGKTTGVLATSPQTTNVSTDYNTQLRAYKASDHQLMYGYFSLANAVDIAKIPDGVDIIALWGRHEANSPDFKAELDAIHLMQKDKGTKFVMAFMLSDLTDRFGPRDPVTKKINNADPLSGVQPLVDSVKKWGLDGIDIDYEPNYCGCNDVFADKQKMSGLITKFSASFGPKSNTNLLLIVDGEPGFLNTDLGQYLNYGISQAYGASNGTNLQQRYSTSKITPGNTANVLKSPSKFIVAENFQQYGSTGGVDFTNADGTKTKSLQGMAGWNPTEGKKGGAGSFYIDADAKNVPAYKYTNMAIQIMNPVSAKFIH